MIQVSTAFPGKLVTTGTLASSTSVTGLASTLGLANGENVTGTGIPANDMVVSHTGTSLVLSIAATVSSSETLTFSGYPVVDMGQSAPSFAVDVENIGITCVPPTGSNPTGTVGLRNIYSQESSSADYITISGCYTGMLVAGAMGDSNSYGHLTMGDTGLSSTTLFECFQVGGLPFASAQNHGLFDIEYVSCGSNATIPTALVVLDGYNYNIRHVYLEDGGGAATYGYLIGSNNAGGLTTSNITLQDVTCPGVTDCIHLSSGVDWPNRNHQCRYRRRHDEPLE